MQHTPDSLWLAILEELDETARDDIYLRQVTPHSLTEESFIIAVPSDYTQDEIEDRFLSDIKKVLGNEINNGCRLKISVDTSLAKIPKLKQTENGSEEDTPETANLNPNYIFKNFVVGQSNRICHATAFAASDDLGGEYNPLFIYGGVGLGKTHLLHAIGNRVQDKAPKRKVLYVTSETFMNEFIESIMYRNSAQGFRTKYRTADLLLIDDIQFLARKEGTQEEFFNTFNDLYMNSNQIVMTSDRSPSMLENLEERLSSRFEWGMVAEIDKPNYELRLSILKRKCEDQDFEDISDEVLSYIAEMVTANIRELEGILIRLTTQATILGERLDIDFARRVLNDTSPLSRRSGQKVITASTIQKIVADHFQLNSDDLTSPKRTKVLVFPRQIAMYLCRELTQLSLLDIAEAFNRQNHRTITYAYEQIEKLLEDKEIKKLVQLLTDELT
ncbi:MAG: chromosomal replication initiator protein DnaA [Candidatus Poribacteria bacterium]|nr:chromosomal replication initiator protein DnaA [Candidatus Poribacteria bacterium]